MATATPAGIIDRSSSEIPGIKVTGNHDHLLRMLAAFEVRDHVVARGVGKCLRSDGEMHSHLTLCGEMRNEIAHLRQSRLQRGYRLDS